MFYFSQFVAAATPAGRRRASTFGSGQLRSDCRVEIRLRPREKQRSTAHGGRITEQATLTAQQTKDELDTWILIRHKIAHGDALPAEPRFIAVATGSRGGVPRLKRANADRCPNFFQRLVAVTGDKAENQFPQRLMS
jgi:hypothetical protein